MTETTTDRLQRQAPVQPANHQTAVAIRAAAPVGTLDNLQQLLTGRRAVFAEVLPPHFDAGRFIRQVLIAAGRTPTLLQCSAESVLGAALVTAELGLSPGPLGHTFLIPRKNKRTGRLEVQVQVGYKGYSDLSLRDPRVVEVRADVVYERDTFEFEEGSTAYLRHRRDVTVADRGAIVAAWAMAKLRSGGAPFVVLSKAEIEARRARSATPTAGPWQTDYAAMCRKTAIRALAAGGLLPLSPLLEVALVADERVSTHMAPGALDALVASEEETEEEPTAAPEPAQEVVDAVATPVDTPAPAEGRPRARSRRPQPPVPPGGGDATAPAEQPDATTPAGEHDMAPAGAPPPPPEPVMPPGAPAGPVAQPSLLPEAPPPPPPSAQPVTYAQRYLERVRDDIARLSQRSRQGWFAVLEGFCTDHDYDRSTIGSVVPWIGNLPASQLEELHRAVLDHLARFDQGGTQ